MAIDKFDLFGPALAKVGEDAYRLVGGKPDGIYVYAEIGDGWVETSVFKDEGNRVRYFWPEGPLASTIMDAWCIEPKDKRWTAMHYTIEGGKFDASFEFDDLEHAKERPEDRRERILRARYGDKPMVYPPLPSEEETFDLKPPS